MTSPARNCPKTRQPATRHDHGHPAARTTAGTRAANGDAARRAARTFADAAAHVGYCFAGVDQTLWVHSFGMQRLLFSRAQLHVRR